MSYKILILDHDDKEPRPAFADPGMPPLSNIESFDEALVRAERLLKTSYPDWNDAVIIAEEGTGRHSCSFTLKIVFEVFQ